MARIASQILSLRHLVVAALLSVLLACAPFAVLTASAAPADQGVANAGKAPYTYTVRVFAGGQGSFNGEPVFTTEGIPAGDQWSFNQGSVTLNNDGRYYIRGIREAGKDNAEARGNGGQQAPSFEVTRDMDLVVAYGILGDKVSYAVEYVDGAGNTLAPSESFYGNVGDSPVIAYRYIEGYQPQAYNLTGRLLPNAADNVYRFVYTALATPEPEPEPEELVTPGTPPEATPPAAAAAAAEAAVAADAPATVEPAAEPGTEVIADDGTPLAAPEGVESIRDDETPLASAGGVITSGAEIVDTNWMVIAGVAALVAVAAVLVVIILRRKQRERAAYEYQHRS